MGWRTKKGTEKRRKEKGKAEGGKTAICIEKGTDKLRRAEKLCMKETRKRKRKEGMKE